MSKNRTMAIKNAKVVKYAIAGGKTALAAEAWNERAGSKGSVHGLGLYSQHAEYMRVREAGKKKVRHKWEAK